MAKDAKVPGESMSLAPGNGMMRRILRSYAEGREGDWNLRPPRFPTPRLVGRLPTEAKRRNHLRKRASDNPSQEETFERFPHDMDSPTTLR